MRGLSYAALIGSEAARPAMQASAMRDLAILRRLQGNVLVSYIKGLVYDMLNPGHFHAIPIMWRRHPTLLADMCVNFTLDICIAVLP
jgi:hypothetical protein